MYRVFWLGLILISLGFMSCSEDTVTGTEQTVDTSESYAIYLTGRVLDKDGKPMGGVTASLSKYNLQVITDENGSYTITKTTLDSPVTSRSRAEDDSTINLDLLKNGQIITQFEIDELNDTLSDVFIEQRDIYGKIDTTVVKSFGDIKASLYTVVEDSTAFQKSVPLGYNSMTAGFSGFIYFVYGADIVNYEVQITIFNSDSSLTGYSKAVPFTSIFGDIEIPLVDPINAIPSIEPLENITTTLGDSVSFTVVAKDSFEGTLIEYAWSFDNGATFSTVPSPGDTSILIDTSFAETLQVIVSVKDNHLNIVYDTLTLSIVQDIPTAKIIGDSIVAINTEISFSDSTTQQFGSIEMYKWDDGITDGWDDSSATMTAFTSKYTVKGEYTVKLFVRDDDGNEDSTTHTITVENDNPVITTALRDTITSIGDEVSFNITATDANGVKEYQWNFGDGSAAETTTEGFMSHTFSTTPKACEVVVTIYDNFDGISYDTAVVTVVQDAPTTEISGKSSVAVNTDLALTGVGSQQFGSIVMYKWDDGITTGWDDSSATMTTFTSKYTAKGEYTVKFLVRDDDGNEDSTTHTVTVGNDNPVITKYCNDTTISIGDEIIFEITATDANGVNEFTWDFGDGSSLQTTTNGSISHIFPSSPQTCSTFITIYDNFDGITYDTIIVKIVADYPNAIASANKASISINDKVLLSASGTDMYGAIVKYEWDLGGTGSFVEVTNKDTLVTAPSTAISNWPCVLRVTDNDQMIGLDTLYINILQDLPTITMGNDTSLSILDSLNLAPILSDQFGSISRIEWIINGVPSILSPNSADTTIILPSIEILSYMCVLAVTDDDSNTVKDTLIVSVYEDAPTVGLVIPDTGKLASSFIAKVKDAPSPGIYGGEIVSYDWSFGSFDNFDSTTGKISYCEFNTGRIENDSFPVVVRVTDDDGIHAFDTAFITLKKDLLLVGQRGFTQTSVYNNINVHDITMLENGSVCYNEVGRTAGEMYFFADFDKESNVWSTVESNDHRLSFAKRSFTFNKHLDNTIAATIPADSSLYCFTIDGIDMGSITTDLPSYKEQNNIAVSITTIDANVFIAVVEDNGQVDVLSYSNSRWSIIADNLFVIDTLSMHKITIATNNTELFVAGISADGPKIYESHSLSTWSKVNNLPKSQIQNTTDYYWVYNVSNNGDHFFIHSQKSGFGTFYSKSGQSQWSDHGSFMAAYKGTPHFDIVINNDMGTVYTLSNGHMDGELTILEWDINDNFSSNVYGGITSLLNKSITYFSGAIVDGYLHIALSDGGLDNSPLTVVKLP